MRIVIILPLDGIEFGALREGDVSQGDDLLVTAFQAVDLLQVSEHYHVFSPAVVLRGQPVKV